MNGIRNSFESRDVSYGSVATSSIGPCRLFHALSAVSSRMARKVAQDNAYLFLFRLLVHSFPREDRKKNNWGHFDRNIFFDAISRGKKIERIGRLEEENTSPTGFSLDTRAL